MNCQRHRSIIYAYEIPGGSTSDACAHTHTYSTHTSEHRCKHTRTQIYSSDVCRKPSLSHTHTASCWFSHCCWRTRVCVCACLKIGICKCLKVLIRKKKALSHSCFLYLIYLCVSLVFFLSLLRCFDAAFFRSRHPSGGCRHGGLTVPISPAPPTEEG